MQINTSTIKARIILITILVTLFFTGIGIFTYFTLAKINQYTQLTRPVSNIARQIMMLQRAEKNFLLKDTQNPDFYTSKESQYIDSFKIAIKKSENTLKTIQNNEAINHIDDTALHKNLTQIEVLFQLYNKNFEKLTELIRKRGWKEFGLVGLWKVKQQGLKQTADSFSIEGLSNTVTELEQIQKAYLFSNDSAHIRQMIRIIDKTSQHVENELHADALPGHIRIQIKTGLASYAQTALKIEQLDQQIGAGNRTGFIAELDTLANDIEKRTANNVTVLGTYAQRQISRIKTTLFIIIILVSLISISLLVYFLFSILSPLRNIQNYTYKLSRGKIPEKLLLSRRDEITTMLIQLNKLVDALKAKVDFAKQIGKGNFDVELKYYNNGDVLGNSLLEMKQNLKENAYREAERKKEEEKRIWANEGMAKFAEILRQNNDDFEQFGFDIMSNLVDYLKINQGALFVLTRDKKEEKTWVEQVAAIAYERQRKEQKKMDADEGLIGRVISEKKSLYLKEIPDDYVHITSGLGGQTPTVLLIVPLLLNEEVYGAIELAAFEEFQHYEIQFVEQLGEVIASAISMVRTNRETTRLLEQSQEQTEQLSAQEEMLRQNMEELQSTQEEADRRQAEMLNELEAIFDSVFALEINPKGKIIRTGEKTVKIANIPENRILGMQHSNFVDFNQIAPEDYREQQTQLQNGQSLTRTIFYKFFDESLKIHETAFPVFYNDQHLHKIVIIGMVDNTS